MCIMCVYHVCVLCFQAQLLELRTQNYQLSDDLRKNSAGKVPFFLLLLLLFLLLLLHLLHPFPRGWVSW